MEKKKTFDFDYLVQNLVHPTNGKQGLLGAEVLGAVGDWFMIASLEVPKEIWGHCLRWVG